MVRRLLPAIVLLWGLSLLFPGQAEWVSGGLREYLAEPVCEYVLEPYVVQPFEQHVLAPLETHVFEPLDRHVLAPVKTHVLEPLNAHVLEPLKVHVLEPLKVHVLEPLNRHVVQPFAAHVLRPAGVFLKSRLWDPVYSHTLGPLFAGARELLEAKVFTPLGLRAPGTQKRAAAHRTADGTVPQLPDGAAPGSDDFEIHFLDVGQGLAVLAKSDGHALLYDGGDRDTSSFVVAYLKQHEVTHLDYLISSHYDSDHLSGLIGVLHTTEVDMVIGADYVHESKTYTSFMNAVGAVGLTVSHPASGSEYLLGKSYFTVYSPDETAEEPNNNSVVIRIVNGKNSFLLTGDAELEEEEALCSSGLDLYSDVLCAGHHGSSNATGSLLLASVQPRWAIISVGADNDYGHPHEETLERLADAGVSVLRTDNSGTIIGRSDGETVTWRTER